MKNESYLKNLKKYADLAVVTGINIQKDQELVIMAPIECAEFTRMLAQSAYDAGAKEVIIHYSDDKFTRIKLINSPLEVFQSFPEWMAESYNYYARRGAGFISIAATDPDIFSGLDSEKLSANTKSRYKSLEPMHDLMDKNEIQWNVISVPTIAWAKKVFPNTEDEVAISMLWDAIFKANRVFSDNPISEWEHHNNNLTNKADFLNEKQFKSFKLKNSLGTDVTIGMPENHIWEGGSSTTEKGVVFFPNMPTEEIFTMPHRGKVNGVVVSSMPLNYQGSLIDGFSLTFKDGRIIDYKADKGYDSLKRMIETDDGSHYLGELALVPYKSPISDMKILFFNTLFDENASCHLAIGTAYPTTVKNGITMTKEERLLIGGNDSIIHVDFMIGTNDLSIVGIDENGNETKLFENGNWAI